MSLENSPLYFSAREPVTRRTRRPRLISSTPSASAGNRWPPVPPAARRMRGAVSMTGSLQRKHRHGEPSGRANARANRPSQITKFKMASGEGAGHAGGGDGFHLGAWPEPRQCQHHADTIGKRDDRGAAIGNERQRHAFGWDELQIDRHVDRGLDAEHDRKA